MGKLSILRNLVIYSGSILLSYLVNLSKHNYRVTSSNREGFIDANVVGLIIGVILSVLTILLIFWPRAKDKGLMFLKPASWPEQARLAAAGKMDELKTLQDKLVAGR
jgi:uncharacterized membrane protein